MRAHATLGRRCETDGVLNGTMVNEKLIRRLQYSPNNRRHEGAHDVFGIVTAIEYGSRCVHMYADL